MTTISSRLMDMTWRDLARHVMAIAFLTVLAFNLWTQAGQHAAWQDMVRQDWLYVIIVAGLWPSRTMWIATFAVISLFLLADLPGRPMTLEALRHLPLLDDEMIVVWLVTAVLLVLPVFRPKGKRQLQPEPA